MTKNDHFVNSATCPPANGQESRLCVRNLTPREEESTGGRRNSREEAGLDTTLFRPVLAIPDKSDKTGERTRKDGILHFRTLFCRFVTFLGVLLGLLVTFAHLFQDILDSHSLSGRLKVTIPGLSRGLRIDPVCRQESDPAGRGVPTRAQSGIQGSESDKR